MDRIVFGLCAMTAFLCAWLLLRGYSRSKNRLLLWSGLCFAGMFFNNLLLIADKIFFPAADLSAARLMTALIAMLLLIYGLVWECD